MLIDLQKKELCALAHLNVPYRDAKAWLRCPQHNWVYDKLVLAQRCGTPCGPLGVKPKCFPVILKPIVNLGGMGRDAERIDSAEQYAAAMNSGAAGRFWMPFFTGEHISLDLVLYRGTVQWHCAWRGYPTEPWSPAFDRWETLPHYLLPPLRLLEHLRDYTGILNVELIGGQLVEAHLRMGDLHYFASVKLFRAIGNALEGQPMHWPVPELAAVPVFQRADQVCGCMEELDVEELCDCRLLYVDALVGNNPTGFVRRCLLVGSLSACLESRQRILAALERKAECQARSGFACSRP